MAEFKLNYTGNQINQAVETANAALPKAGGTMTGALTLSGDPTSDNHAANKKYVDQQIAGIELTPGGNGASAYQIACDNGFKGSEAEWLESLKGKDGKYYIPSLSATGYLHFSPSDGEGNNITSTVCLKGRDGAPGDSAYQIACDNGFVGSEAEWLESLKGEKGDPGSGGGTADSVAWEDITGKPFGNLLTGSAWIEGKTLMWDGDTSKSGYVVGDRWHLVNLDFPDIDCFNEGCEYATARYIGTDETWNSSTNGGPIPQKEHYGVYIGDSDWQYIRVIKEPCYVGNSYFAYAGIYFYSVGTSHTCRLTLDNRYFNETTEEIAPIPEKYMPDGVATKAEYFVENTGITWDGVVKDGMYSKVDYAGNMYVRVSDRTYPVSTPKAGFTIISGGVRYVYDMYVASQEITDLVDGWSIRDRVYCVYQDNVTINGTMFPKAGIYFRKDPLVKYLSTIGIKDDVYSNTLKPEAVPEMNYIIMKTAAGDRYKIEISDIGQLISTKL